MAAKNIALYIFSLLLLFGLITLLKGWLDIAVLPLWIGGLIGIFLPEIDSIIYAYFLRPHEYDAQRMQRMINQGQVIQSVQMGTETRAQHQVLVFHTGFFQIVFLLFSVFVVTSTASLLGMGLVISFLLNLLVDQYIDFQRNGHLDNWFKQLKINLTREQTFFYLLGNLITILLLSFVL